MRDTNAPALSRSTSSALPEVRQSRRPLGEIAYSIWAQLILLLWAGVVALPLVWMVITAFKTDREIFFSPWELPASPQWSNFARAWNEANIGTYFVNSVIVVAGSVSLTLLCGSLTAYVLARYTFRLNRLVYYGYLLGLMFPVFLALVPLFFVVRDLHLLNTRHGLILVYTAYTMPFAVFFLTSFFRSLPTEVGEAAIIDGASHYRLFFQIMLPMAQPGIMAAGIFVFLSHWNQFILPYILTPDPDRFVLSQGLAFLSIQQGYASDWSALFAGLTIAMIPTLIVYILFQRRLQQGLTAGALKA